MPDYYKAYMYSSLASLLDTQTNTYQSGISIFFYNLSEFNDSEPCKTLWQLYGSWVVGSDEVPEDFMKEGYTRKLGLTDKRGRKTEKFLAIIERIKNHFIEHLRSEDGEIADIWIKALEFKPDFKECDIPEYNDVHKIDYAVLEDEFERDELSPHHRDLISRKSLVLANELREFLTGSSDYADYHNTSKQKLFAKFLYHSSREPLFQRDLIAMCLRFYQIIIFADKEEVLNDLTIIRQRMKKCLCYNSNEEAEIVLQAIRYTLESEDLDIRDCWKKLNGMLSSEFTSIIQDLYEGQL